MAQRNYLLLALVAGCGGGSTGSNGGGCPSGYVLANPDGRGSRCILGNSECLDPMACGDPAVVVDCCTPFCGDPDVDYRFTCEETCLVPDCSSSAECGEDERCESYNECSGACVPDLPCEAGQVMADPDGAGFRCVPASSECFRPTDCAPSANPLCCDRSCTEGLDGRFTCEEVCQDGTTSDFSGIAYQPVCYTDSDCDDWYGAGNWVCDGCPGTCVAGPPECAVDADCVVATDARECCACPEAFAAATADAEPCIVGADEEPAAKCLPDGCDAGLCGRCAEVFGATCVGGACTTVWL